MEANALIFHSAVEARTSKWPENLYTLLKTDPSSQRKISALNKLADATRKFPL